MNAYELADYFEYELKDVFPYCILTIRMLRQQADRIAELEKKGKPVAWMYPNDNSLIVTHPLRMGTKVFTENDFKDWIPLYTTPQTKPLNDEEIEDLVDKCTDTTDDNDGLEFRYNDFVRAIEEKHGIK